MKRLRNHMRSPSVRIVLVHFLTVAVEYLELWAGTAKPVFICCHGVDVTWNLRRIHASIEPAYSQEYFNKIRELPDRVRFIANSETTKSRLEEIGIQKDRIHVKYNGVEVPGCPTEAPVCG